MSRTERSANSRAEQVRQRRNQQSDQRQQTVRQGGRSKKPSQSRTYEVNMPPVVVRGNVGTPVLQRTVTRQRQRRQVAIPLRNSGAEVVIQGLPVIQLGTKWVSIILAIALSIALLFMLTSSMFQVTLPEVQGLQRLTPQELESALRINGESIFSIRPATIEQQLEAAFPELKDVQVTVGLPASVTIAAVERQPTIHWQNSEGSWWSDDEGVLFQPRGEMAQLLTISVEGELPLAPIEVSITEDEALMAMQAQALTSRPGKIDVVALTAALEISKMLDEGTILAYDEQNGFGWVDAAGCKVYVGSNIENMSVKMAVYEAILQNLQSKNLNPRVISVANVNAPFYRMEP